MLYLTGFESTFPVHLGSRDCVLSQTRHLDYWQHDLTLVSNAGVRWLRYPIPWHHIERIEDVYDWSWMDPAMAMIHELGIDPIVDPLHHTSFPHWLCEGFLDPRFEEAYVRFIRAVAQRYPWVNWFTVFNEPLATLLFCGHEGVWYPFAKDPVSFVMMVRNAARTICRATAAILEVNPKARFMHNDSCEFHQAPLGDTASVKFARFLNERRFLIDDLVLGRVDESYRLWWYLQKYGFTSKDLNFFGNNPARIDIRGLDYYALHEHEFYPDHGINPSARPAGFAAVARQYVRHLKLPIMLAETNIRGYFSDRLSWLKYMVEQAELLVSQGIDFRGFCWFPFVDSTDWDTLLRRCVGSLDPVGLVWLDKERRIRNLSELYDWYAALVRGRAKAADLPANRFRSPLDRLLVGCAPQMSHWQWQTARG